MTTIPGSWAGMIPFFPTGRCGCWVYSLPTLTNFSTGSESWALTHTTSTYHNQTDFPSFLDQYLVNGPGSTESSWECIRRPGCTGYTSTFEIFDIPPAIPVAMLAFFDTYVTTTSPAPYSATLTWELWWSGVYVWISINCFYYWPFSAPGYPTYQFSTAWRLEEDSGGLAGTPDFAFVPYDYVIGTNDTMTGINHPLAGVYTITDAELCAGRVWFQGSDGIANVDDVIGPLTFLRPGCMPLDGCYFFEDLFERAGPGLGGTPLAWETASRVVEGLGGVTQLFTIDAGAAITECEQAASPDFLIGSMCSEPSFGTLSDTGFYIEVEVTNFFQLLSDPVNFRAYLEICNFVDIGSGAGRCGSFRLDAGSGFVGSEHPVTTARVFSRTFDGVEVGDDAYGGGADPYLGGAVDFVLRLESYYGGGQKLYLNGGLLVATVNPDPGIIDNGSRGAVLLWWDAQFVVGCGTGSSPRIERVTRGCLKTPF